MPIVMLVDGTSVKGHHHHFQQKKREIFTCFAHTMCKNTDAECAFGQ